MLLTNNLLTRQKSSPTTKESVQYRGSAKTNHYSNEDSGQSNTTTTKAQWQAKLKAQQQLQLNQPTKEELAAEQAATVNLTKYDRVCNLQMDQGGTSRREPGIKSSCFVLPMHTDLRVRDLSRFTSCFENKQCKLLKILNYDYYKTTSKSGG